MFRDFTVTPTHEQSQWITAMAALLLLWGKMKQNHSFGIKANLHAISWYLAPGNTDFLKCAYQTHALYEVLFVTQTHLKTLNSVIWDILGLFKRETIEAWRSAETSVAACVIHWGCSFYGTEAGNDWGGNSNTHKQHSPAGKKELESRGRTIGLIQRD